MNQSLMPLKLDLASLSSVDYYFNQIRKIPVLSAEAEQSLAEDFYYHQNLEAARQLVVSNLRFVVYIAQGYTNYGLPINDLVQEGNIGLMKAVKRFNPTMKVRLISFAVHWIKAEIQEFILRNWRIVKVATTKAKRKLFFNLRKAKKHLGWSTQKEIKSVAQELGVPAETVQEMEAHLISKDISFNTYADDSHQEDTIKAAYLPVAAFSDGRYNPEQLLEGNNFADWSTQSLKQALEVLDKRSRNIIVQRWLTEPKSKLKDLARYYNISIERIRQLEKNAIKILRQTLAEPA